MYSNLALIEVFAARVIEFSLLMTVMIYHWVIVMVRGGFEN
jgi:hypothetical protein